MQKKSEELERQSAELPMGYLSKAVIHIILVKWKDICYNKLNIIKHKEEKNMRKKLTQIERKYICFWEDYYEIAK